MLIDTHCHLTDKYTDGAGAIVARAGDAGVGLMICATAEPADFAPAIRLADENPNVFATIGIHPEHSNELPRYTDLLNHKKVVGVGEIGLDYHYRDDNKIQQQGLFLSQLEIARTANLPVAVHSRDAANDTLEILQKYDARGVMHSFAYDADWARRLMDTKDFYFSVNGIITFKNGENLRDAFRYIPLDRIVIETDAPYLAPTPFRGIVCEPAMITKTAEVLAQIKKIEMADLEIILYNNTKRLFPKL
ncbi:MAG: TatD family hydrolase [Rickettsiales bacterium]|jgi:TatD DNase family protein|nr:TatD family hydrolase [Rickettsiales bacterium]